MKYCMEELKISIIYLVLKGKLTQTKGYYFVFCDDERLEKYTNQEIIKQIEDQKTKLIQLKIKLMNKLLTLRINLMLKINQLITIQRKFKN